MTWNRQFPSNSVSNNKMSWLVIVPSASHSCSEANCQCSFNKASSITRISLALNVALVFNFLNRQVFLYPAMFVTSVRVSSRGILNVDWPQTSVSWITRFEVGDQCLNIMQASRNFCSVWNQNWLQSFKFHLGVVVRPLLTFWRNLAPLHCTRVGRVPNVGEEN
jgi:hypothetical protein